MTTMNDDMMTTMNDDMMTTMNDDMMTTMNDDMMTTMNDDMMTTMNDDMMTMSVPIVAARPADPARVGSVDQKRGGIILAQRGPDPFGPKLTQSARTKSDPGCFCTIRSVPSVGERNRV